MLLWNLNIHSIYFTEKKKKHKCKILMGLHGLEISHIKFKIFSHIQHM